MRGLAVVRADEFNTWVGLRFFLLVHFGETLAWLGMLKWLIVISLWQVGDHFDLLLLSVDHKSIQLLLIGPVVEIWRIHDDQLPDVLILCDFKSGVALVILESWRSAILNQDRDQTCFALLSRSVQSGPSLLVGSINIDSQQDQLFNNLDLLRAIRKHRIVKRSPAGVICHVHQVHGVLAKNCNQAQSRLERPTAYRKVHRCSAGAVTLEGVAFELNQMVGYH